MKAEEEEAGRPSIMLPSLLLLPHTAPIQAEELGGGHMMTAGNHKANYKKIHGSWGPLPRSSQQNTSNSNSLLSMIMAWMMGTGVAAWITAIFVTMATQSPALVLRMGAMQIVEFLRERAVAEARHLVSGATELNAMDGCLSGKIVWHSRQKTPHHGSRLQSHQQMPCWIVEQTKTPNCCGYTRSTGVVQAFAQTPGASTPANKRVKREKTVVFDLPGELISTSAAGDSGDGGDVVSSFSSSSFLLSGKGFDSSTLKQSTTVGRNITSVGEGTTAQ
ncbi:hypothetical protein C4B63_143g35 [Trypanosoma cruzi]|uniref:Uncharacterized protein n=1 Tax=Trypanosoma cruzi TaxID=5693 RepID=A0A2V2UNA0_TRYCR|nr:hypothetical protein C4B63_143g35 [Trypanosoma cruzi]